MGDDFDDWVFDEEFVKGGRREAPARTRMSIAKYGDGRPDWRAPATTPRRTRVRHRALRAVLTFTALALAALGLVTWLHPFGLGGDGAGPARPVGSTVAADAGDYASGSAAAETGLVHGLTPRSHTGDCFTIPAEQGAPDYTGPLDLNPADCTATHRFELITVEQAQGESTQYPTDAYWSGPIMTSCHQAFTAYAGFDTPPSGEDRVPTLFRPTRTSWAAGDRTVYCLASSQSQLAGTVRAN